MMTPEDKELLDGSALKLMRSVDLTGSDLLAQLRNRKILTSVQEDIIQSQIGEHQKINRLLQFLKKGNDKTMDNFLDALTASGQGYLLKFLRAPVQPDLSRPNAALPSIYEKILLRNWNLFVQNMLVPELSAHLLSAGVLTYTEYDMIRSVLSRREAADDLLSLLLKRGYTAFASFREALQLTGQPHLARVLEEPRCESADSLGSSSEAKEEQFMLSDIITPGNQQLYYEICEEGSTLVYRTRLMLVGHFGAGKTSLKSSLLDEPFKEEYVTTDGIDTEAQLMIVNRYAAVNWREIQLSPQNEMKSALVRRLAKCMSEQRKVEKEDVRLSQNVPRVSTNSPAIKMVRRSTAETEHVNPKLTRNFQGFQEDIFKEASRAREHENEDPRKILTLWDFGGQHVYYTSHQTFLSNKAVYLLTLDMSKPLDQPLEESDDKPLMWEDTWSPTTIREFLDFWLNSVHTHLQCRELAGQALCPPVIIVCTKTDLLHKDPQVRQRKIDRYIEQIQRHLQGKPYYAHVHDIIAVSNLERKKISQLKDAIMKVATYQPYWGKEEPIRWLLLAAKLNHVRSERQNAPLVDYDELKKIAHESGVQADEIRTFLAFHHDLGDLFYFDETGLNDKIILCPQWLANTFRTVITQDGIMKKHNLSKSDLDALSRGLLYERIVRQLYPEKQASAILQLMQRFDLLVPYQQQNPEGPKLDNIYIVPCRLPLRGPSLDTGLIPSVHFKLVSKSHFLQATHDTSQHSLAFLPNGFFHRLVACCCTVDDWNYNLQMIH